MKNSQDLRAKKMTSNNITETEMQARHDDITICCICNDVYNCPKLLPCLHTFCMKCIQETGLKTNKGPGDEMPCPMCRRLFKIPPKGLHELPENGFISRLIQVSKAPASRTLCSVCQLKIGVDTRTETPAADAYCFDCKRNFCAECCSEHSKYMLKLNKEHKLIPITEYECVKNETVCEIHDEKVLEIFCDDCKIVVCAMCFFENHKSHKGDHVKHCVDGFRNEIETNTKAMNECISHAQIKKADIIKVMEEIKRMVESLECDVEKRKFDIKNYADEEATRLKQDLCFEKQSRLKSIQMAIDDIDDYLSCLESYTSYCQMLTDKGWNSVICREVSCLSLRATELQQQCQPMIKREFRDVKFRFRQSELEEFLEEDFGNLLGKIEKEGDTKPKKRGKQILLPEQNKEVDILRREVDDLRKERSNNKAHVEKLTQALQNNKETINELESSKDQLKQEHDTLETTNHLLQTSCDKERADHTAAIEKLTQALENNQRTIKELQASKDQLKREHDALETKNKSLQTNNDKFVEELELCKAKLKTVETNDEKFQILGIEPMTNDEIKRRIRKLYVSFISDVNPQLLGDHLKQESVISVEDWEATTANKITDKDKCRAVLDFLLKRDHPFAFLVVRQALEKDNHHILKAIQKDSMEVSKISSTDQRTMQRSISSASGHFIAGREDLCEGQLCIGLQKDTSLPVLSSQFRDNQPVMTSKLESLDFCAARYSDA